MNSVFLDIVLLSFLFLLASVLVICDFQGIYPFRLAVKNFGVKSCQHFLITQEMFLITL